MRKGTLVLALVIIAIMSSCGSSREFSKRKYTSGVFKQKSGIKKSSEQNQDEYYSEMERSETIAFTKNEERSLVALSVNTNPTVLLESDQSEWESGVDPNELGTKLVIEDRGSAREEISKAHPVVSENLISKEKKEKEKEKKTDVEKRSKLSFWFGLTAAILGLTFIALAIVSQSSTIGIAWSAYFLVRKAMLIFGFLGAGFGVAVFLEKDESNRFKKHAKAGFWMSVLVLLFFLV